MDTFVTVPFIKETELIAGPNQSVYIEDGFGWLEVMEPDNTVKQLGYEAPTFKELALTGDLTVTLQPDENITVVTE